MKKFEQVESNSSKSLFSNSKLIFLSLSSGESLKKTQLSPFTLTLTLYSLPANNDFSTTPSNFEFSDNFIFSGLK